MKAMHTRQSTIVFITWEWKFSFYPWNRMICLLFNSTAKSGSVLTAHPRGVHGLACSEGRWLWW